MPLHRLLERQLKRSLGIDADGWAKFVDELLDASAQLRVDSPVAAHALQKIPQLLERISESYAQSDRDLMLIRRNLELSSSELTEANHRLREEGMVTTHALATLKDAFNLLLDDYQVGTQLQDQLNLADISEKVLWLTRERERMRQALKESEERFDLAMRGANDGVWDWNLITNNVYFSPRWKQMIGYSEEEIANTTDEWSSRIHPDDMTNVRTLLDDYLAGRTPGYEVLFRFRHRNGEYLWILSRGRAVWDSSGRALRLVGTHADMTDSKNAEVKLRIAKEKAEQANQAKSDFLSSMSHELRTPMNAILGFGQILEQDRKLGDNQREAVREILHAGRHLLTLINEVLDLSKIESGKIDVFLEAVRLKPAIQDVMATVESLAQAKNITLVAEISEDKAVKADRVRLKQVLLNLLSNAIKYNHPNGRVLLSAEQGHGDTWRISITDTGPGISAEKQEELFQPFNRLGFEGGSIQGTGIGLVITKKYVEGMGGKIGVLSRIGRGSVFWIELIQTNEPSEEFIANPNSTPNAPGSDLPANAKTGDPHKILYIDDNIINLRLMEGLLEDRSDIHLITIEDPRACISSALAQKPELIMLDIFMPDMDGYELIRQLKENDALKSIPVIAVTANAMSHDMVKGKNAGFSEYLTKPIDYSQLMATLDKLLPVQ